MLDLQFYFVCTAQPIDAYNHEGTLQVWQESGVQNSMYPTGIISMIDTVHQAPSYMAIVSLINLGCQCVASAIL